MKGIYFINAYRHFCTIMQHKLEVMKLCFKIGLYYQGIMHDLSKYSFTEFRVGVLYFRGYRSPNAVQRNEFGYSDAWLHHKGRNKHHFEYWTDYGFNINDGIIGIKMPLKYVLEMVCDRIAASKIYYKDKFNTAIPYEYYITREKGVIMHKDTAALLESLLILYKDEGEKALVIKMRELLANKEY